MATVAEVLAHWLRVGQVARLFGLPGGEVVHALEAVRREGLAFVLTRHETAAAFMAAATAQLSRAPSACLTTLGPGAANATAGLAHAYLDRSPVLLITGQLARRQHTHQYLDLHALFDPISKASWRLLPADADQTVPRALELARGGRPGPVHLQLTSADAVRQASTAGETADPGGAGAAEPPHHARQPTGGVRHGQLDTDAQVQLRERGLEAAAGVIARSRRPAVVCGLGLEPEAPYAELQAMAEALGAPVITTPKAKGALPAGHPLAAGVIGLTLTDPAYAVLDQADCILAVGFDPVELVRPWDQAAALIWIGRWENADPQLPAAAEIVGELAPALRRLAQAGPGTGRGWAEHMVTQPHSDGRRPRGATGRMRPQDALAALREAIPPETVVSVDVGSHKILTCLQWPMSGPNRFLVSNGLSSMGYALPATVAARLAHPGVPALCLTGDAGLAMVLGELGTLAEVGGPAVVVVFRDDALDLIRSHQLRAGLPPYGTEFRGPDFARIAEAHGLEGLRVTDPAALARVAQGVLHRSHPVLIEVPIDPASYPTTPA